MKITCQSCQSKYNVADEKVEGKIVKIRCRKCGATIVVNGTVGAATNGTNGTETPAQQDAAGAGDGTQWHVNVGDNDTRTLTLAEVIEAYNSGVVTQETFIWCDGMDDWRPLGEVEAVVAALHATHQGAQVSAPPTAPTAFEAPVAPAPEPRAAANYEAPAYEAPAYEAPPPYVAPAAYMAPAPEPKRAAVAKRETRARDLFATSTGGEELHTSAPVVPQVMAPSMDANPTGQRNENSVLFSLAVLTKNADARPVSIPPASSREDSGLIDLKALAQKAESMRPMAMGNGDVFHAPLGLSPPMLGAPVGALASGQEAQPKSKLPLLIGGGAGVMLFLVVGIVIGVKWAGGNAAPVPAPTVAMTTTATAEPSAAAPPATAESSASAAPSSSVAALKKPGAGPAVWHPAGATGAAVAKPPTGAGGSGAATPTPTPTPKKAGGDCGCNGDLMCLMKCSTH